jgi:hypothetical protein
MCVQTLGVSVGIIRENLQYFVGVPRKRTRTTG